MAASRDSKKAGGVEADEQWEMERKEDGVVAGAMQGLGDMVGLEQGRDGI